MTARRRIGVMDTDGEISRSAFVRGSSDGFYLFFFSRVCLTRMLARVFGIRVLIKNILRQPIAR